ncbi:vacuolar protein sorting 37A [Rhodnius prolixus]
MDSFVESTISVDVLRGHTQRLIETTEKLANDNLALEPELLKLQSEVSEKFRELCDLRMKYDNSNLEYQKLCEKYNPKCIKESLLQSVATIDEESEKVAEAFLSGETDLESFVQDYISHRALSHSHKIRYEKLSKQLEKLKQAGY